MGIFITLEGMEGSGKSTQMERLAFALKAKGKSVLQTREPGGTPMGRALRNILLTDEGKGILPETELLLYMADRAQHVRTIIRPALAQGKIVLCDRYQDSTLVYQGYARGLDPEWIENMGRWATGGLVPRWTLLLDCPVEVGLGRAERRLEEQNSSEDRFEKETLDFHKKIRQGFLDLAKKEKDRFVVLDASRDPDEIHHRILHFLEGKIL